METLDPRAHYLSNFEVLELLKAQKSERSRRIRKLAGKNAEYKKELTEKMNSKDFKWVTSEAQKYLEKTAPGRQWRSRAALASLLDDLERLGLAKAERLQIVNLVPITLVELVVVGEYEATFGAKHTNYQLQCVDDLESRFPTEEDQQNLIEMIKKQVATPKGAGNATNGAEKKEDEEDEKEDDKDDDDRAEDEREEDEKQHELENMLLDHVQNEGSDDDIDDHEVEE